MDTVTVFELGGRAGQSELRSAKVQSIKEKENQLQLILQLFRTLLEFYKRRTATRKDFYKPHLSQMMAKCIKFVNAEVEADHQNMEENATTTMTTTSYSTSPCSSSAYSSILQATLLHLL